ncbi:hypothetical protein Q5M85_08745 [Paraclostridium bifermentans]|nr:hypothetical protein [Paraclostridium bifermentans]
MQKILIMMGMKGFKENLLKYTESVKDKSKNSMEMVEKDQLI